MGLDSSDHCGLGHPGQFSESNRNENLSRIDSCLQVSPIIVFKLRGQVFHEKFRYFDIPTVTFNIISIAGAINNQCLYI
jgi:hypothetical protein